MFKIINRWGFHSCRTFTEKYDAQVYAASLNRLSNQGWRVVMVLTGRE